MLKNQKVVFVIVRDHEKRVKIRREIENAGHSVVSATSGTEALNQLSKTNKISLFLLNDEVLDMSIEELLRSIRQTPGYERIPISQITASETSRFKDICCVCRIEELEKIIAWLNTGAVDGSWRMP